MKNIILLIAVVMLSSCGKFKKLIHKTSHDSISSINTKTISAIDTHTKTETVATKTVSEQIDTTVAIKTATATIEVNTDHPRDTSYQDGPVKIIQTYDPLKRILKIRTEFTPPPVHIYLNKHTEEKSATKSEGDTKTKSEASVQQKTEVHDKTKEKTVESRPAWQWYLIFFVLGFLFKWIFGMFYKYCKKTVPWLMWLP